MSDSMPENYGQGDTGVAGDVTTDSTAVESNETGSNPYWDSALENIPKEFHSQLTPTFKQWDDNYAKDKERLSKYEQYTPFLESNVPAGDIDKALELVQLFQNNPRDMYDYLKTQYNFTDEQAAEAEEEILDLSGQGDIEKNPRFIEMQQQTAFMQQQFQQQADDRIRSDMRSQIDKEVAQVAANFPMFNIADVAAMATGLGNAKGTLPNLVEAAQHMANMLPKDRVSDNAPPSLSGNRGIPSNKPNYGAMSSEDRSKLVADMIEAQNRQ